MNSSTSTLTARTLILTLIDSARRETLSARYFVAAGELFGLDSTSVRVALGRLVKDGSLRQRGRGVYELGSRSGTLHRLVRNWARVEASTKTWKGDWVGVFVAHLSRSNKTALRGRERALRLFGFAEPQPGLWVRPDNLVLKQAELRSSLLELGLDARALTYTISELAPTEAVRFTLWDRDGLEAQYRKNLTMLAESTERFEHLNEEDVGRETLTLGRAVTRDILLDPLLPSEMVDIELRAKMVAAMRAYDRLGKDFWRRFEATHNARSK
ncbi:MAG: PaaX [Pseudomonadota bacterium]